MNDYLPKLIETYTCIRIALILDVILYMNIYIYIYDTYLTSNRIYIKCSSFACLSIVLTIEKANIGRHHTFNEKYSKKLKKKIM